MATLSTGYIWQSGDTVTPGLLNQTVNSATVSSIVNADVSNTAGIAGTKIAPNFGSQAVSTTGTLAAGNTTITGTLSVSSGVSANVTGNLTGTASAIADSSVTNAKVASDAAILGTKISPNFGSQNIVTTGGAGIGTSSPAHKLHVVTTDGAYGIFVTDGTRAGGLIPSSATGGVVLYGSSSQPVGFWTNNSEKARIDSDGNFFAGYTSGGSTTTGGVIKAKGYNTKAGSSAGLGSNVFNVDWASPTASLYVDATNLGAIQTSSDYRVKREVETQTAEAIARIKQIRPVTFKFADYGDIFKAEDKVREGFIAHELAEVVPSAVDGEKDAPNQIQSLRLDALCAVLVKAVQELSDKVEALEQQ